MMFEKAMKKKSVAMKGNHFRAYDPDRLPPVMLFLVRS